MFLFSFTLVQKDSFVIAEIADEVSDNLLLVLEKNNCFHTKYK